MHPADIKEDLKNHFRISLLKKDWTKNFNEFELLNQKFTKVYDSLKKKFFMRKVLGNSYINLNEKEISFFSNFFHENSFFSDKFLRVNKALSKDWACWVKLNDYRAAEIANKAHENGTTLEEEAIKSGYLTKKQFKNWVKPEDMV